MRADMSGELESGVFFAVVDSPYDISYARFFRTVSRK